MVEDLQAQDAIIDNMSAEKQQLQTTIDKFQLNEANAIRVQEENVQLKTLIQERDNHIASLENTIRSQQTEIKILIETRRKLNLPPPPRPSEDSLDISNSNGSSDEQPAKKSNTGEVLMDVTNQNPIFGYGYY